MLAPQMAVMEACRAAKQKSPEFEYTGFHVGLFMNYLGAGAPDEEAALHGFNDNWKDVWWHPREMKAEIPLTKDGTVPSITMTEIRDVGRFVAAACLLPDGTWQENFSMVGETIPMDEIVSIIERVRGKKMDVEYRPYEKVVESRTEEEDFYRKFWYQLEEMNARNRVGEGIVEPILNELCPSIKSTPVAEYVRKYWGL
jgi:nucleoside-diphosphate-sugar epimerase